MRSHVPEAVVYVLCWQELADSQLRLIEVGAAKRWEDKRFKEISPSAALLRALGLSAEAAGITTLMASAEWEGLHGVSALLAFSADATKSMEDAVTRLRSLQEDAALREEADSLSQTMAASTAGREIVKAAEAFLSQNTTSLHLGKARSAMADAIRMAATAIPKCGFVGCEAVEKTYDAAAPVDLDNKSGVEWKHSTSKADATKAEASLKKHCADLASLLEKHGQACTQ